MNYKWPKAEKQLPTCLVQPRGRNLRAKTATEIKEAKEVFWCNLSVPNFQKDGEVRWVAVGGITLTVRCKSL